MQAESPIKVACLQMEPKIGDKNSNVSRTLEMIGEAAGNGAQLFCVFRVCLHRLVERQKIEAKRRNA